MMKRSFVAGVVMTCVLTGSAMSADMPTKSPVSRPEVFSWSGFYLGGHLGYGLSSSQWDNFNVAPFIFGSGTFDGALGGLQMGVNWQTGAMVFGVEADFSLADMSGETCNLAVLGASFLCSSKVDRFGTITGRIGGAFDRTLLYLKAGGAWARETQTLAFIAAGFQDQATVSKSKWGWTSGAGVEYAVTRSWSAKLEYDFLLFGTEPFSFALASSTVNTDIKPRIHTVKLGFNYRFDWSSPVAARY
jgi:outer membrane immunogenic protein